MFRQEQIEELMRVPWRKMHCGQLAYRMLHDVYGFDVREHDLWVDTEMPDIATRVDEYLSKQGDRWMRIGSVAEDADSIGDVIWSGSDQDEFGRNHLSVVIDTMPTKVITTTSRAGAPFIQLASRTPIVRGVFRFIGEFDGGDHMGTEEVAP